MSKNCISVGIDYGDNDATTAVATAELDGVFYIIGQYYDKSPNKLITEKGYWKNEDTHGILIDEANSN